MNSVHTREASQQPAKETQQPQMFNIYPVLGIALVLLVAAMAYGGLLIFLFDEWTLFASADATSA